MTSARGRLDPSTFVKHLCIDSTEQVNLANFKYKPKSDSNTSATDKADRLLYAKRYSP